MFGYNLYKTINQILFIKNDLNYKIIYDISMDIFKDKLKIQIDNKKKELSTLFKKKTNNKIVATNESNN
jgi:hypothetical protein